MKQKEKIVRLSLGALIVIVTMLTLFNSSVSPALAQMATPQPTKATNTTVALVSSSQTVNSGDSFDLNINISTDGETRAAQFILVFDPKLVEIDGVVEGNFYKDWAAANGGSTVMLPQSPKIDTAAGKVEQFGIAVMGAPRKGPTGNGTLATFHVKAIANGTANFSLESLKINDPGNNDKGVPTVFGGVNVQELSLSIGGSGAVAQPTARPMLAPTSPNQTLPTQEATAVKRTSSSGSGSSESSFPWIILIPVVGVIVIGGVVLMTSRKK